MYHKIADNMCSYILLGLMGFAIVIALPVIPFILLIAGFGYLISRLFHIEV